MQICLIKAWRNKIQNKLGELVLKTTSPSNSKSIITLVLCPILIVLSLITKATFFVCCLMITVSCLACYINCSELVYKKLNGIYRNGIVGSGKFIPFDKIDSFPDTSWKEPEKQNTNSLAIQLVQVKKEKPGVLFIDYDSISEYVKVVNAIKSTVPALAK